MPSALTGPPPALGKRYLTRDERRQAKLHYQMSPLKLIAVLFPVLVAFAVSVPVHTAPSFDAVMRPCMDLEALEPPARRVATCLCYFEKRQSWTVNASLLVMGETGRATSRRAALNECRAMGAHLS